MRHGYTAEVMIASFEVAARARCTLLQELGWIDKDSNFAEVAIRDNGRGGCYHKHVHFHRNYRHRLNKLRRNCFAHDTQQDMHEWGTRHGNCETVAHHRGMSDCHRHYLF